MAKLRKLHRRLRDRDGRCWLCAQKVLSTARQNNPIAPSGDHVIEQRNGGGREIENLRLAHRFCNSVRATHPDPRTHPRYISEVKMRLTSVGKWDAVSYTQWETTRQEAYYERH